MFLSKEKSGIYYLYYEGDNGKRTRVSTRTKAKSQAYSFISEFKLRLKLRQEKKLIPMTLSAFMAEILRHSGAVHSPKTTSNYVTTFRKLMAHFGDVVLGSLTKADIENYVEKRIRETSVYAGKKDLAYLSASFRYAVDRKYVNENICHGIRTPRIPEKMPLFFSREEFNIFVSVIDNRDMMDIVVFGANTGCRQGELVNLMWNQVDLVNRRLVLDNRAYMTKSKRVRTIPLNSIVSTVLQRRRENATCDYVFTLEGKPVKPDRMNKFFKRYVIKSKLNPHLHYHSLRHSFASWLVLRGVSLYQVQKLLGHSTSTVTQIYAHLASDTLAGSVEKLEEASN